MFFMYQIIFCLLSQSNPTSSFRSLLQSRLWKPFNRFSSCFSLQLSLLVTQSSILIKRTVFIELASSTPSLRRSWAISSPRRAIRMSFLSLWARAVKNVKRNSMTSMLHSMLMTNTKMYDLCIHARIWIACFRYCEGRILSLFGS